MAHGSETPAPRESRPLRFESRQLPKDLRGKDLGVVYAQLQKRPGFAGFLATPKDLDYIKEHPQEFPHLQNAFWHYAFGSTTTSGGNVYVQFARWNGTAFSRDGSAVNNATCRVDQILLRV